MPYIREFSARVAATGLLTMAVLAFVSGNWKWGLVMLGVLAAALYL